MSPVHRHYLKNMQVSASLSLSIKKGDTLWGMVVCHHNEFSKCQPMTSCHNFVFQGNCSVKSSPRI
ncbi:GAF domain-containing protein [Marinomonas sp. RS-M-Aa-14]|uniref:GAF domain-containing protein n=1 Tax=Marinomonas sp. RS-M-Aa-14 TaxID=3241169 RepID=UPI003AB0CD19